MTEPCYRRYSDVYHLFKVTTDSFATEEKIKEIQVMETWR